MTIATWNINGMQARLGFVRHWLQARTPDVVLLQELKLPADRFPHAELETAGYQAVVHGQKSWNGVAILTRTETVRAVHGVARGLPGAAEQGARLVAVELELAGWGALHCCSVYVPNGRSVDHPEFAHKLAFLDGLIDFTRGRSAAAGGAGPPLIIGGDFNLCPAPLDTWDEEAWAGKIFHTAAERSRFQALSELGLVDLFRARHPDRRLFSWWDYRAGDFHQNRGLRIDLLLAALPVAARSGEVWIDRDYRKKKEGMIASDHAPVIAELAPVIAEPDPAAAPPRAAGGDGDGDGDGSGSG